MPSSKNASPPAIVSSLRQSSAVFSRCAMVVKCANTMSPMTPSRQQPPKTDGERLVVIVLADEDDACRPVARGADRLVVLHPQERRLLDQHVLAGRQRLQREIEMEPRRHGDDHRIDPRIVESRPRSRRSFRSRRSAGRTPPTSRLSRLA